MLERHPTLAIRICAFRLAKGNMQSIFINGKTSDVSRNVGLDLVCLPNGWSPLAVFQEAKFCLH